MIRPGERSFAGAAVSSFKATPSSIRCRLWKMWPSRLNRRPTSRTRKSASAAVEALRQLEIDDHADHYPSQLSGGMQKRLALARAIVTRPELVFFDEPTAGLDPLRRNAVFAMIAKYQRQFSFTALIVTHDVDEALVASDRVALLDQGRICFEGTPAEFSGFHQSHCAGFPRQRRGTGELAFGDSPRRQLPFRRLMKQNRLELSVGIFVLLGIAAVAYLTMKLGSGSLIGGDTYLLEARFANAGGLHIGSSVLVAGVTVGRVDAMRVDPTDYSAIATLRILTDLRLPTDSMASIKTTGLIGDKYVFLSPGADETFLQPGTRITMTESSVDLESLLGKMAFGSTDKETEESPPP